MLLPAPKEMNGVVPARMFYGQLLSYSHGNHQYRWGGKHVPSVTTIQSRLAKQALLQWYADCAADGTAGYIIKNMQDTEGVSYESFRQVIEEARAVGREAANKKRDEAGDAGSAVHNFCHDVFVAKAPLPVPDDPKIAHMCEGFLEWYGKHKIYPIDLERMVMSERMMYAGRCDFFGRIDENLGTLDIKTGNIIDKRTGDPFFDVWLQLCGYEIALAEELDVKERTYRWCLHIDKQTGKCQLFQKASNELHVKTWTALVFLDGFLRQMARKGA